MDYLNRIKLCAEIEKTILALLEVTSVYCALNTFYIHTENFKQTKNKVGNLFQHISKNLNQNFNYELIRVYAGALPYKS